MSSRFLAGIAAAALCILCLLFLNRWSVRIEHLRWISERQRELRSLGERVLAHARQHEGRLPESLGGYVDAGILGVSELTFTDALTGTKVSLELRPIPRTSLNGQLILFVESYEPKLGGCNVVRLNGYVTWEQLDDELLSRDNELRSCEGLSPIKQTP